MLIDSKTKEINSYTAKIPEYLWFVVFYRRFDIYLSTFDKEFDKIKRHELPENALQAFILLLIAYPEIQASAHICFAQSTLKLTPQKIFSLSAAMGCIDILHCFKEQSETLTTAKKQGILSKATRLFKGQKKSVPTTLRTLIQNCNYEAFRYAAANGQQDILIWLQEQAAENLQEMIRANNYEAFRLAATYGYLKTLIWLHHQAPHELKDMIEACEYEVAYVVMLSGHYHILKWLQDQAPEELKVMIRAYDYGTFSIAADKGNLDMLIWLRDQAPEEFSKMIKANNYGAFRLAAANGHFDTLIWFQEQAPEEFEAMIKANNFEVVRNASENNRPDIVEWLLQHPSCLAYAEINYVKYSGYVHPFIERICKALLCDKKTFISDHPHEEFDINDPLGAQQCFYMIRNLIRRNDRRLDDVLEFLLSIPSVRAIAHQEIYLGNPNELMQLAILSGNKEAANQLIKIDTVKTLTEQHNFYKQRSVGFYDLNKLSDRRESSMANFSYGEKKILRKAISHYQPVLLQFGAKLIINQLRQILLTRYMNDPALVITQKQGLVSLPYDYQAFCKLNLNPKEKQRALEAYYQHPTHSAWRYLSKPNPWLHSGAKFTLGFLNYRYANFEEYQDYIALFFLAASDDKVGACDGLTLEGRLEHFINELGLIGRAHNWDKTHKKNGREEEYDDLKGDKPSCPYGVKRRLFQSVIGNPLLNILTEDSLLQELRSFARTHFISLITDENKFVLSAAFFNYFNFLEAEYAKPLLCLNISEEKQKQFHEYLNEKYGEQFTDNISFILLIDNKLALSSASTFESCHALKLESLTHISDYLKNLQALNVSTTGFFACTKIMPVTEGGEDLKLTV